VEPNRKGRLLVAVICAVACGCNRANEDRRKTEAPAGASAEGAPAGADPHAGVDMGGADPHAGVDMGGGGGANPHAGVDNPHGGMDMGGGDAKKPVEVDKDGRAVVGPLRLAIPKGWQNQPAGGMRAAQWTVPGGKEGEATLVVYYFGEGGAGGVEDNLQRWKGQFQPEGGAQQVSLKTEVKTVAGMKVTLGEIEGRYVASMTPGSAEKNDEAGWMLAGAILETESGPYYFKLTGPKETVMAARKDFRGAIESAQLKK